MSERLLVATDGSPEAMGALRVARELEAREGASVQVVAVVEPVPVLDAGVMATLPEGVLYTGRQSALEEAVREQLAEVGGGAPSWPVTVDSGVPGPRITRLAQDMGARRIVLGLGRHRTVDRLFGSESALQVIRLTRQPVLAVPAAAARLPRTAVVAVDFSPFCAGAAEDAARLLDSPAKLHLVHCIAGLEYLRDVPDGWEERYRTEIQEQMDSFARGLTLPEGVEVHTRIVEGEPAREILAMVDRVGADLLAAGSHGHSFVGRILMGSVSTRLIRGASTMVLVYPPGLEAPREGGKGDAGHPWVRTLDRFTRRHAGRPVVLELDDPELGAQITGRGFPLRGVDFDPRTETLHIMMGPQDTPDGHVTHSIRAPLGLEVALGEGGEEETIRVQLARGHLLLRILRE